MPRSGTSISRCQQEAELKDIRAAFPAYAALHSHVLQDVLARLDRAYQAFFRRRAAGEKDFQIKPPTMSKTPAKHRATRKAKPAMAAACDTTMATEPAMGQDNPMDGGKDTDLSGTYMGTLEYPDGLLDAGAHRGRPPGTLSATSFLKTNTPAESYWIGLSSNRLAVGLPLPGTRADSDPMMRLVDRLSTIRPYDP